MKKKGKGGGREGWEGRSCEKSESAINQLKREKKCFNGAKTKEQAIRSKHTLLFDSEGMENERVGHMSDLQGEDKKVVRTKTEYSKKTANRSKDW